MFEQLRRDDMDDADEEDLSDESEIHRRPV